MGASTISSGKKGYETPTGVFTVLEKEGIIRRPTAMRRAQQRRLTWKGVALHAETCRLSRLHGCIRLPIQFSSLLFSATKLRMTVIITSLVLQTCRLRPSWPGRLQPCRPHWLTRLTNGIERATSGPVSVIVSSPTSAQSSCATGVEIGSSPARINGTVNGGPMPCAPGTTPDSIGSSFNFPGQAQA
jgi:hypothetical protein